MTDQTTISWIMLTAIGALVFTRLVIIPLFIWDGGKVDAETKAFDARVRARR